MNDVASSSITQNGVFYGNNENATSLLATGDGLGGASPFGTKGMENNFDFASKFKNNQFAEYKGINIKSENGKYIVRNLNLNNSGMSNLSFNTLQEAMRYIDIADPLKGLNSHQGVQFAKFNFK